jgi:hypothetical protein
MKRTILLGTLTAALLAPFAVAHAYSDVSVSVSTPEFGIRIGGPVYGPVPVYAPAPVYAPVPVYAPMPVYAPRPVYVTPRVIYPAPVIVVPPRYAPRHFGPRAYWHRDWDDRRDGRREHRGDLDRNGYRAGYGY